MKFLDEKDKENFVKKVQENKGKLKNIEEILEFLEKGMTRTQIASHFGVSKQSISKLLIKYRKTTSWT